MAINMTLMEELGLYFDSFANLYNLHKGHWAEAYTHIQAILNFTGGTFIPQSNLKFHWDEIRDHIEKNKDYNFKFSISNSLKQTNKMEEIIYKLLALPPEEYEKHCKFEIKTTSNIKLLKVNCIFIGHGRSKLWARVNTMLTDELGLKTNYFERDSHTGQSIVPILESFLEEATFAILVMTAEDETSDGTIRARQNVVHEAGLFQGRLGFNKVVILKQEGLENFSNVDGLQYIPFTGDNIEQTFYELQRTMKREGLLN